MCKLINNIEDFDRHAIAVGQVFCWSVYFCIEANDQSIFIGACKSYVTLTNTTNSILNNSDCDILTFDFSDLIKYCLETSRAVGFDDEWYFHMLYWRFVYNVFFRRSFFYGYFIFPFLFFGHLFFNLRQSFIFCVVGTKYGASLYKLVPTNYLYRARKCCFINFFRHKIFHNAYWSHTSRCNHKLTLFECAIFYNKSGAYALFWVCVAFYYNSFCRRFWICHELLKLGYQKNHVQKLWHTFTGFGR